MECKGFVERAEKRLLKCKQKAKIASLEQNRARFSGWRQNNKPVWQCHPRQQPFPSWKWKFPSPNRVGRHTHSATSRPTCQEATIARRFCPQHSRGGGVVVVEVQATGDDVIGQHSGRLEIGNSNCGGSSPIAVVDSTLFDVEQLDVTRFACRGGFFARSSWN